MKSEVDYSVYEAKARFSELLRRVKRNQSVVITSYGKPVARIVPYEGSPVESLEHYLDSLEEEGIVSACVSSSAKLVPMVRQPGAVQRLLDQRD